MWLVRSVLVFTVIVLVLVLWLAPGITRNQRGPS